jgi:hypothetical protein
VPPSAVPGSEKLTSKQQKLCQANESSRRSSRSSQSESRSVEQEWCSSERRTREASELPPHAESLLSASTVVSDSADRRAEAATALAWLGGGSRGSAVLPRAGDCGKVNRLVSSPQKQQATQKTSH